MSHYASEGFDKPGGVDTEEYEFIKQKRGAVEGMLFRVISQPNSGPTPMGITFTQYSTCFSHNIQKYVDNGWRDEGFESPVEKECVDWINTKPDCSLEVVLKHNPDLAEKLKHGKPTNWALKKDWERQQDQRRGKFI